MVGAYMLLGKPWRYLHFQEMGRKLEEAEEKALKEGKEDKNQELGEFNVKKTQEGRNLKDSIVRYDNK